VDALVIVVRLLLSAVFALAAVAKLADRGGFRRTLTAFGVPAGPAGPLAVALPVAELLVAVALLPAGTAWWGAVGALALLLAFTAAIAVNLARGRRPACNCFGQVGAAPIGWSTLIRNGVLAAAAGVVVARGPAATGPGPGDLVEGVSTTWSLAAALAVAGAVVVLAALGVVGWLLVNLIQQHGRLLLRVEELEAAARHRHLAHLPDPALRPDDTDTMWHQPKPAPAIGEPAPDLRLPDLNGDPVDLADFRGSPTLLLFWNPNCGFCRTMLPDLKAWDAEPPAGAPRMLVVSGGPAEANRSMGLRTTVVLDESFAAGEAFGATGTPMAVLLDADLAIASEVAVGRDAVLALAGHRAAAPAR
jgi:thiol-disulfide isomerase/thioredoxin